MRAVRPLVVALATLVGGSACDRLPTGVPQPSASNFPLAGAPGSQTAPTGPVSCAPLPDKSMARAGPHCFKPKYTLRAPSYERQSSERQSNYAVAW